MRRGTIVAPHKASGQPLFSLPRARRYRDESASLDISLSCGGILFAMFGPRVTLRVTISSSGDGCLHLAARLIHPHKVFHADPSDIIATLWAESDDVIRISLQHRASRTLAYLQGNQA